MIISHYRAAKGEANWGRPLTTQVAGGAHITFECITHNAGVFYMTRWPHGLPGHDDPPDTLRFPHGLIRIGETLERCVARLVKAQLGMRVRRVRIAYWDSYLDKFSHWHVEPGCIVDVQGTPHVPRRASEIVRFDILHLPKMTYWPHDDLRAVIRDFIPRSRRRTAP